MRILITGANGFIGKNLAARLRFTEHELVTYTKDSSVDEMEKYCSDADFIFHLAGINRPKEESEYMDGNYGFTLRLLNLLKKHGNKCPIMFSSSVQASLDNSYGVSKKACEELLINYAKDTGTKIMIYRLPNVFGKWSKPNYNSFIATMCYNMQRGIPIEITNRNTQITLLYIDDLVDELVGLIESREDANEVFYEAKTLYQVSLGDVARKIEGFSQGRTELSVPDLSDAFCKKLYSTYLSFTPTDKLNYPLKMNVDDRGSFTEFIKTPDRGQISINISKPGIQKGNHWHNTKVEKFLVVSGEGIISFRNVLSSDVIQYHVSGEILEVLDVPVGYTHCIENIGSQDMVTIMWVNEVFNPAEPDTFFDPVNK